MAKDDETGVEPVAANGEPDENEIERRRRKREAKNQPKGGSIAARAESGELAGPADGESDEEEDDGQFAFVVEGQRRKVTLGTMIPRGTPTEYRIVMGGKSQKGVGGLLDPTDTNQLLLVEGVVSDARVAFVRDDRHQIEKAIVYVTLAPKFFMDAKSEAARALMAEPPPAAAQ